MKTPVLCVLLLLAAGFALAYDNQSLAPAPTRGTAFPPGTTNVTGVVDVTRNGSLALAVDFTGITHTYAALAFTNNPNGGGAQKLGLFLDGTWTVYKWTNTTGLTLDVPTNYSTRLTLTVTNLDGGTNGTTFTFVAGGGTNTYTITNSLTGPVRNGGLIASSTSKNGLATNIFNQLAADFGALTYAYTETNAFTVTGLTNYNLACTSDTIAEQSSTTVAVTTNTIATNLYHVPYSTNSSGEAATNLYTVLVRDYPLLNVDYLGSNVLRIATSGNQALVVTNNTGWATNAVTTNAIAGTLTLYASNSLNRAQWFAAPAYNVPVTIAAAGGVLTNWSNLGGMGYFKWAVGNPSTNGAANALRIESAIKEGF